MNEYLKDMKDFIPPIIIAAAIVPIIILLVNIGVYLNLSAWTIIPIVFFIVLPLISIATTFLHKRF